MNHLHYWKSLLKVYNDSLLVLVIWNFFWEPFFPQCLTFPSIKIKSLQMSHLYSITIVSLHLLTHVSCFIMSNHYLLMFLWPPLGFFHVVASLSHPCSEHPRWVSPLSMEVFQNLIESCYSISSLPCVIFIMYFSYLASSYPDLSLTSLCLSN